MAFIDVPGCRLYAESHGPQDAPALLWLHGAGSNAATWWQQLGTFAQHFRCITLDQRCFGRSAAPMADFSHQRFVPDALAVLDHFGVQRAAVVGQSLGGMVGLRLALAHPERVSAFVACDSPLGLDHPAITEALARRAATASSRTLEQRALGAWFLAREPEKAALYAQINAFNPGTHSVPAAEWKAAMDRLVAPENLLPMSALAALQVPVLWLVGGADPLVPVQAMRDAQAQLPGSELAILAQCGHSAYFERPDAFNHAVLDFLQRRLNH